MDHKKEDNKNMQKWSIKDDILFILSIIIEKLQRYIYEDIFWIRLGRVRNSKLTIGEWLLWKIHIIFIKIFPHWRTKFIQGIERHSKSQYKGRYTRLDDFYPHLKRLY